MTMMMLVASRSHFTYDELNDSLALDVSLGLNMFVAPRIHHPSTSLVSAVAILWVARGDLNRSPRRNAPKVPIRYPAMLLTMMIAAVNSMLAPFLLQMMRDIMMVKTVSRSSSSMPKVLHTSAVTA